MQPLGSHRRPDAYEKTQRACIWRAPETAMYMLTYDYAVMYRSSHLSYSLESCRTSYTPE